MFRMLLVLSLWSGGVGSALAQSVDDGPRPSFAAEADVLAYGLPGYSGILNVSLASGLQFAFGVGRYEVPGFMLEGDPNFDTAQWQATVTSLQIFRATYRFRGPMTSGPAVGVVALNQHWRLSSDRLRGEARFRPISLGVTGGYYAHVGRHFYLYPTAAFTFNTVYSGEPELAGTHYEVRRFGPVASLHLGWEWSR